MDMTNRAYSILDIKEVDEEKRIIRGMATTPTPDRAGDIVKPEGAKFTLPIPLLWQHWASDPIGHVTEAKVTSKGIEIVASIAKDVTEDIEKAWKLIKSGLVRGLSIGFRGTETEQIPNSWGVIFNEWEWLELSAVTIPANSEATITSIKSIDTEIRAALGTKDKADRPDSPGASGKSTKQVKLQKPKEKPMANSIAEQISAFEVTRASKAAELETIMTTNEGETLDADAAEAADTLTDEIKSIDAHIKRLRTVESVKAAAAKPVAEVKTEEDGGNARDHRLPAQVRAREKLAPGIALTRFAKVKALAKLDGESPRDIARELYGENSPVYGMFAKSAVQAGATDTWAGFLVGDETSIFADFAEYLRPMTILGKFGSNGVPSLRRVPFRTPLLSQTGAATGYWVGEGAAKPVTSMTGARTTLSPLKAATIAVVTEEVLRDSSPSAEMIVRDEIAAAIRERLDTDFIDPSKSAVADISPASITNGITPISSSGTDADAVRVDVQALFTAFINANNPPTSGVWIMPATMALALSLMVNPLGQPEFPTINMNGGTFFGLPVIVSEYVPTITGGSYVILANSTDVYFADEGGIVVDMSREASLQMDNQPTMSSDTPTGTSVVSLWQTNSVGFRAERTVNWARRRSTGVQVLSGVAWAPGSGS